MALLALNCGSSSVKCAVFDDGLTRLGGGMVEGTGPAAIGELVLAQLSYGITAVGHRVVHGGPGFSAPVVLTPQVRASIEALVPLAPVHQPHNIAGFDVVAALLPDVVQVACFDTAFHRSIPRMRQEMALPGAYAAKGLLRYGFHGLSCQHVAESVTAEKIICCHLGNGCSVTAIEHGRSVYTSMGFTPADGLMMGTRSGALDPGAVLWLVDELGDVEKVRALINSESGLKGVSGLSSDMRVLLGSGDAQAAFAVAMFVDRLVLEVGRAAAALKGIDALVFTGGIGENAGAIRKAALAHLSWLGLALDETRNDQGLGTITTAASQRRALVLHANEEQVIARSVLQASRP